MNSLCNSNSVIDSKIAYFRAKYRINFTTSTRSRIMSSICVTVPTEDRKISNNNLFPSCLPDPTCHLQKDFTLLRLLK